MESGKVKIVGISGTPIEGGNCDKLVQKALETAREIDGVETEFITLADKKIAKWMVARRDLNAFTQKYAELQDSGLHRINSSDSQASTPCTRDWCRGTSSWADYPAGRMQR